MSGKLHRAASLGRPVVEIDAAGNQDVDWIPYPHSNQSTSSQKKARLPLVRRGLANLTEIMVDVRALLRDNSLRSEFDDLLAAVREPYNRLQQWLEEWPKVYTITEEPVPQLLTLR